MKVNQRTVTKKCIQCPLCEDDMSMVSASHDGIKKLLCDGCGCELHFKTWEQQARVEILLKNGID